MGQELNKKYGLKTLFLLFNLWKIEKCFFILDQANTFAHIIVVLLYKYHTNLPKQIKYSRPKLNANATLSAQVICC